MLLSGGIDSAAALYFTRRTHQVRAITFVYHGIARQELDSARAIGAQAKVHEHRFVRLPDLKEAGDIGMSFGRLPPTYIPLRNSIFYSFGASYAEEVGAQLIVGGHNRDDERIFDDVSPRFFHALERAFEEASPALRRARVRISRPLKGRSKPQVIKLAASLGVPFGLTWSCHRDGTKHCWECQGCLTRTRSFSEAGVTDPLLPSRGKIS